jgi:hypothetical protein
MGLDQLMERLFVAVLQPAASQVGLDLALQQGRAHGRGNISTIALSGTCVI